MIVSHQIKNSFAQALAMGHTPSSAAKLARLPSRLGSELAHDEYVLAYVETAKRKLAEQAAETISKSEILHGFREAIDLARHIEDPNAMIKGWTEIGKVMKIYEKETTNINISVEVRQAKQQLRSLSDEELLKLSSGLLSYELAGADEDDLDGELDDPDEDIDS